MQKQTYSCGNTPQPGDVVHLLSIPSEPHIWPTISGLEIGKEYVVDSFCERIKIKGTSYYHAPSRFRLLRRAGEQPQPDENGKKIMMLKFVLSKCDTLLSRLEDTEHGSIGKRITDMRGLISKTINGQQPQPDILQAAIKLRLHLEAEKDIPKTNWKKGDRLELENNVFDKNTGIAFIPLDLGWKVNGVEILESDPQPDYAKLLEEKDEAIRELVEGLEHARDTTGSEEYYEYFDDLITKHKPQP